MFIDTRYIKLETRVMFEHSFAFYNYQYNFNYCPL